MKKWLLRFALLLIAGGALSYGYCIYLPKHTVHRLDLRFAKLQRGMTEAEVQALMDYPSHPSNPAHIYRAWDDSRLLPADAEKVVSGLCYSVKTFHLPVTFEVQFDRDGKVIGRHRYD